MSVARAREAFTTQAAAFEDATVNRVFTADARWAFDALPRSPGGRGAGGPVQHRLHAQRRDRRPALSRRLVDIVTCRFALHHTESPAAVVAELAG